MNKRDIDKAYVSPYDQFMYKYDFEHDLSPSQEKEIKKHQRIANLRDILTRKIPMWKFGVIFKPVLSRADHCSNAF